MNKVLLSCFACLLPFSMQSALAAQTPTGDKWLFTPGPLTTAPSTKEAMLHDLGSRDEEFSNINARVLSRILTLANAPASDYAAVPMQGSGTFSVEAMIGSFLNKDKDKILVIENGVYGKRMAKICERTGKPHRVLALAEDEQPTVAMIEKAFADDPSITHVGLIYCETTTGMLNPLQQIAISAKQHNKGVLVDAISAFGAIPIDAQTTPFDALVMSANKGLEGVPGLGVTIVKQSVLTQSQGQSPSLSLDLYDQWVKMQATNQWRFTPPTHVMLALDKAMQSLLDEGGIEARHARYQRNCSRLNTGLNELGFTKFLSDDVQAPVIMTYYPHPDKHFVFADFYDRLKDRGFLLYPGKLTKVDTFRIGCIGDLHDQQIDELLAHMKDVLNEMQVQVG